MLCAAYLQRYMRMYVCSSQKERYIRAVRLKYLWEEHVKSNGSPHHAIWGLATRSSASCYTQTQ